MDKEIGIYVFENRVEHKAYIGQSSRLSRRIQEHYMKLKRYKDEFHKTLLTNPEYFIHSIVEYCSVKELDEKEGKWMELYKENGWEMYNKMWRPMPNSRGTKLSEEIRKKISEVNRARTPWNKGKHLSEEICKKLSEAKKGEKHPNYGKHLSEETKKKISEIQKGRIIPEERRKKLSESHKGKHWRLNSTTGKREWY